MTEALRPTPRAGGLGARPSAGPIAGTAPRAGSVDRTVAVPRARTKAEPRRPVHIAVVIGLSAGAYAVSLAGVTSLQSASEQSLIANSAPTSEALDLLQAHHDRLDGRLAAAGVTYDAAAAAYKDVTDGLSALEVQLGTLSKSVGKVQKGATWSPSVWRAPIVSGSAARSSGGSTAHATTCASGKVCP